MILQSFAPFTNPTVALVERINRTKTIQHFVICVYITTIHHSFNHVQLFMHVSQCSWNKEWVVAALTESWMRYFHSILIIVYHRLRFCYWLLTLFVLKTAVVWLETGLESRNVGVQDDITWGGRLMNDCKPLTENFGLYTLFWSNQLA